jgi:ABC-type sugar transport system ATPase subunit
VGEVAVEHADGAVTALFRPEHLALGPGAAGTVRSVAYLGFEALATVDVAGEVLQVRVGGLQPPEPGASVGVRLGPPSLVVPRASPGNPL